MNRNWHDVEDNDDLGNDSDTMILCQKPEIVIITTAAPGKHSTETLDTPVPQQQKWRVDELAVMTCFKQAVASHDNGDSRNFRFEPLPYALLDPTTTAPSRNTLDGPEAAWEPATIPLPAWAVQLVSPPDNK
jgi:hypothetical protein